MRYVQPYGITDLNAPYINGDPSVGRMGSIPDAKAFEHPQRELINLLTMNNVTPDELDLRQVGKSVRSGFANFVQDTGLANSLTVALNPVLTAYTVGLPLRVKVLNANTGPATIDAGGGRVAIRKPTGAELGAGDLSAGGLIEVVFDGTNFQMINFGGAGAGGGTNVVMVNVPYVQDSGTANNIVANYIPPVASLQAGSLLMVRIANTNGVGPVTLNVNGLGPMPCYAQGCTAAYPTLPGDMNMGDVLIFAYDGSRFWFYANDSIQTVVNFPVATNVQFDDLFNALARKRILPNAWVQVTMLTGIYNPVATSHPNANRIAVVGQMKAARPVFSDFQKTGYSPAARAQDSNNNIAMLRARYGVEIKINNATQGSAFTHVGGGMLNVTDILITGDNVSAGDRSNLVTGISVGAGSALNLTGVSVWGTGGMAGFFCGAATIQCTQCYAVGNKNSGFYAVVGGTITMFQSASYGNDWSGVSADRTARVSHHTFIGIAGMTDVPPSQHMCNGSYGVTAASMANVALDRTNVTNNATDIVATGMAMIGLGGGTGTVYGTTSPAVGVVGNNNSVILSGV